MGKEIGKRLWSSWIFVLLPGAGGAGACAFELRRVRANRRII